MLEHLEPLENLYAQKNNVAFSMLRIVNDYVTVKCNRVISDVKVKRMVVTIRVKCHKVIMDVTEKRKLLGIINDVRFVAGMLNEDFVFPDKQQLYEMVMDKYICSAGTAHSLVKFVIAF